VQALAAGLRRLHRFQNEKEPVSETGAKERKKIQPQEESERRRRKKNFQRICRRKSKGRKSHSKPPVLHPFDFAADNSLRLEQAAKRQVALEMLLEHEMLHFAVDYACAQWEVLLHAPCWRSLMQRRREKGLPYIELEESLANAYMLRRLSVRWNIPILKAVERFTCRQPSGYNNAGEYVEKGKFDTGLAELAKTYVAIHASERGLNVFSPCFDYASIFPVYPSVPVGRCPIQIVKDLARFGIPEISVRFLKCIPEIVETELFQKLFSQMPHDIQKRWNRKKEQLKLMLPRHPEFENFRDHFSLRLGHNFRAHLRPVAGQTHWEAFEIGPHTKMGHG
jgi:hypothetical protein